MTEQIQQSLLQGYPPTLALHRVQASADIPIFAHNVDTASAIMPIGVAHHLDDRGQLSFVALATTSTICIVNFNSTLKNAPVSAQLSNLLSCGVVTGNGVPAKACLVGFSFAKTALHVAYAAGRPVRGIDLSTALTPNATSWWPPSKIIGNELSTHKKKWDIVCLWLGNDASQQQDICLQAWLAACVAKQSISRLESVDRVYTGHLAQSELAALRKMAIELDLLERDKPVAVANDFISGKMGDSGKYELLNARFKTRVRRSDQTRVVLTESDGNVHLGQAVGAKGKTTKISVASSIANVKTVKVMGREEPTSVEIAIGHLMHSILTGTKFISTSYFVSRLWFPSRKATFSFNKSLSNTTLLEDVVLEMGLNDSQKRVAKAMADGPPIIVTHGPPGTGKTTTIAAAARVWRLAAKATWIVAHSNVGVKNVAESLAKKGVDFKLLVSREFYEEWHEHLYAAVEGQTIRSDEFSPDKTGMERILCGSHITL